VTSDRFEGCLLGLALGDALGAPHEGGPVEKLSWRVLGRTGRGEMRWTDDTQMALDIAESIAVHGRIVPDDLALRFAESYRWDRGYGAGAARLLKAIARGADWREANRSVFPDGSFGNGGAMRVPVVGLLGVRDPDRVADDARASAEVTHAHPRGQEGAVVVAAATAAAAGDADPLARAAEEASSPECRARLETAAAWRDAGAAPDPHEVVARLGHGIAAAESCATAVYIAVRFLDATFDELMGFVIACGGDTDTIGAMAGGIWGARRGAAALPEEPLARLEQRDRLQAAARAVWERVGG